MIGKLIEAKKVKGKARRYMKALATYISDASPERARRLDEEFGTDVHGQRHEDLTMGLDLADYVAGARAKPEKVAFTAALIGGEPVDWATGYDEAMRRLDLLRKGNVKGVRHVVFSVREPHGPTEEQAAEIFRILCREAGCDDAVVLLGAHEDTDNPHVHGAIVTVGENGEALGFGAVDDAPDAVPGRQAKLAVHRTIAWAEHLQGWSRESGGLFEVVDGVIHRRDDRDAPARDGGQLSQYAREKEAKGFWSLERIAREEVMPVLKAPDATWQSVHRRLAPLGLAVRQRNNGGVVVAGETSIKLSTVDRTLSWSRLTAGPLGEYEPPPEDLTLAPFAPWVCDEGKARRFVLLKEREAAANQQIDTVIAQLQQTRDDAVAALKGSLPKSLGSGKAARAARILNAEVLGTASAEIAAGFDARIAALRALRGGLARDLMSFDPAAIDFSAVAGAAVGVVAANMVAWVPGEPITPIDVPGYYAEQHDGRVDYRRIGDPARRPAFSDCGSIIWLNVDDEDAIRAMIRIGEARWGSVAAFGTPAEVARLRAVGAAMGVKVGDAGVRSGRTPRRPGRRPRAIDLATCRYKALPERAREAVDDQWLAAVDTDRRERSAGELAAARHATDLSR